MNRYPPDKYYGMLLRWLIVLAMPVVIVLTSARVMVQTWYPRFEYARAGFPADPYGFTTAERLERAIVCIDFLNSPQPAEQAVAMLEALRLPNSSLPLFTSAELGHMVDVKRFTDLLWRIWRGAGIILFIGLILLGIRRAYADIYAALFGGGLLTVGLLAALAVFVLVGWRTFFIGFHEVFFPQGNWTFDWSDSLIRLFPDRFWFDAGVLLVGGALVAGGVVLAIGYGLGKRARKTDG